MQGCGQRYRSEYDRGKNEEAFRLGALLFNHISLSLSGRKVRVSTRTFAAAHASQDPIIVPCRELINDCRACLADVFVLRICASRKTD